MYTNQTHSCIIYYIFKLFKILIDQNWIVYTENDVIVEFRPKIPSIFPFNRD